MGGRGALRGTQVFDKNDQSANGNDGGGGAGGERDDLSAAFFNGEDITTDGFGKKEKAFLQKAFGQDVDNKTLAALIGAPDGSHIDVSMKDGQLKTLITHPYISEMERHIGFDDDGDVFIKNDMFFLDYNRNKSGEILNTKGEVFRMDGDKPKTLAPAGFGTASFAKQVDTARAMKASYIKTYALRNDDPEEPANGSYTWARLGYDGYLDSRVKGRLYADLSARSFRNVETVHELMRHSKQARDWWKVNHQGFSGIFSLERGSTSLRVFNAYKRERGIKTGRRTPTRDRGTGRGNSYSRRIPEQDYDEYGN